MLYQAEETGPAPAPVVAAIARGKVDLITIWSRRNAVVLARRLGGMEARLADTTLLAISPAAAEPLADSGFLRILVAEMPDHPAMLTAIRSVFAALQQENRR